MTFVPDKLPEFGEFDWFTVEGIEFSLWAMNRDGLYELKSSLGHIGYLRQLPDGKYAFVSDNIVEGPATDWRILVARHTNGEIGPPSDR